MKDRINFNVLQLKDGLMRMANKLEPPRPAAAFAVKPTNDPKESRPPGAFGISPLPAGTKV